MGLEMHTRKSRRRDTQKLPLMTHGNAAGAIVRYWPPHSATSYVASSYVYGSTCDTIVPFSMCNMLQCAWSAGPLSAAQRWSMIHSSWSPSRSEKILFCKNNFSAPHYETFGRSAASCFILPHFINNGRRLLSPAHHDTGRPFVLWQCS